MSVYTKLKLKPTPNPHFHLAPTEQPALPGNFLMNVFNPRILDGPASAIICRPKANNIKLIREPDRPPRFSAEVWREIALCIPKGDLKSLLLVPHARSRIASQLIFREIDLHFTASPNLPRAENRYRGVNGSQEEQELDAWHYQRSADILTRILVNPVFASQIRSLSVYAVVSDWLVLILQRCYVSILPRNVN
ncbi:hypothetical protein DFH29DRAFT_1005197 [Suillus ampliporus]|nr:hypothetical protein DFH29DRAFT_1005197 [Suillus ampliporus]